MVNLIIPEIDSLRLMDFAEQDEDSGIKRGKFMQKLKMGKDTRCMYQFLYTPSVLVPQSRHYNAAILCTHLSCATNYPKLCHTTLPYYFD
jgi:hypothetical protein